MAISNLPYDDGVIVRAVEGVPARDQSVSDVRVDFLSDDIGAGGSATVTATITWSISAADAVAILDQARLPQGAAGPATENGAHDPNAAPDQHHDHDPHPDHAPHDTAVDDAAVPGA